MACRPLSSSVHSIASLYLVMMSMLACDSKRLDVVPIAVGVGLTVTVAAAAAAVDSNNG